MVFVIRTEDNVAGLDISLTLTNANIKHDLLVKEKNEWWNKISKQHRTSKKNNPWCSNCKEKDCLVELEGTCEMIRRYLKPRCVQCETAEKNLDLIAEVERLKGENKSLKNSMKTGIFMEWE